jgi:hypothetical protein
LIASSVFPPASSISAIFDKLMATSFRAATLLGSAAESFEKAASDARCLASASSRRSSASRMSAVLLPAIARFR